MRFATLPATLEIDGVTHIQHWRSHNCVVLQNYTLPVQPSNNPLVDGAAQIAGQSMFHVFEVIQHEPAGETLGNKLATFTDLHAAMNFVAKQEQHS